ncbi:hypothetical protein HMPREF1544_11534 [Mucor circinelloides 1006PhL]|uniref:Uncharacterized protein n=1 Tax=Mucor circinelloides f. circinelloides (strain 1006PhL) TaxID=1220926 RepID=S2JGW5_MUCC1|nr:hypothetical protein HMPREF1544_11534 [Mucor circinelloides 1006PhL]
MREGQEDAAESRAKSMYDMKFIGTLQSEENTDQQPKRIKGIIKSFRDPGHSDTYELPGADGGALTPCTAFGNALIQRLEQDKKMVFEVKDV